MNPSGFQEVSNNRSRTSQDMGIEYAQTWVTQVEVLPEVEDRGISFDIKLFAGGLARSTIHLFRAYT